MAVRSDNDGVIVRATTRRGEARLGRFRTTSTLDHKVTFRDVSGSTVLIT